MGRALLSVSVALLVFLTGAAGLIYQVVFERYLARLLGSDHVAVGLTLAVFLGGLAVGYALCGRLTLAVRNHLRVYAALEGAIGLWGLIFPALFAAVSSIAASWSFAPPALFGLLPLYQCLFCCACSTSA